ncbi:hypothetical protein [Gimesia sp.]|uniref:hypothetical protein n=1 Tax=Gimesia sp. TaxID=2024833 RepID=UPI0032ECA1FC
MKILNTKTMSFYFVFFFSSLCCAHQKNVNEVESPQLENFLSKWEKISTSIRSYRGSYQRCVLDNVYKTVQLSEGKFYYDKSNWSRIDTDFIDTDFKKTLYNTNDKSQKYVLNGTPYKIIEGLKKKWICDSKKIVIIDDLNQTYTKVPFDSNYFSSDFLEGPLPFFFGMSTAELKKLFYCKLLKETENEITLTFSLRNRLKNDNHISIITFNKKTILPIEAQIHYPNYGQTFLYKFINIEINRGTHKRNLWLSEYFGGDKLPFEIDLSGHSEKKVVIPPSGFCVVPYVLGFNHHDANKILKRSGLNTRYKLPEGQTNLKQKNSLIVQQQSPSVGKLVREDASVYLELISD